MRVARVETIPYALGFRDPYVTARGRLERREMVLLRLMTDDGAAGLGEAVPLSLRGGESLARVSSRLHEAALRLVGLELAPPGERPLDVAIATFLELGRSRRMPPPALAALECALFDLAAKVAGEPLWRVLGASRCEPVRCNATLAAGEPGAVAAAAACWAADGFETFKVKLGDRDAAGVVRAVRDAVGTDAKIRLDANEAWSLREAKRHLAALEPLRIELAEQPVAGLGRMARLARSTPIPLAADESVASEGEAHRARAQRSCAYVTAKLSKVGGIGAARAISAVLPTYLSSALDGPVGIAAAAHAAQLLPDPGVAHGLATQRLFGESIASRECALAGGLLQPPDGAGLGVELDESLLSRARLDRG